MGCDIHMIVEEKINGKWVAVSIPSGFMSSSNWHQPPCLDRNYQRFSALAGVRGTGPSPRGAPVDASETTMALIDEWDIDGHSHSYLPLDEAAQIFMDTCNPQLDKFNAMYPIEHFFVGCEFGAERRLVFWFDN